jgi:hypothetical protein
LILFHFLWQNCSIFTNSCIVSLKIPKPCQCTLLMEGFPTVPRGLWGPLWFGRSRCDKQNKLPSLIDRCLGVFIDGQINHTSITRLRKLTIPMCMMICKPCGNLAMEVSTYMDANSFRNAHNGLQ